MKNVLLKIILLLTISIYAYSDVSTTLSTQSKIHHKKEVASVEEANLEHLKQYIGTYSIEEILNDKVVSKKLKLLLGSSIDKLKENLTVRNPIDMINKGIVMSGIAPHEGGYEMAIVDINLQNQKVTVAIYSNNTIKIYSDEKNYKYLPRSITSKITLWNAEFSVLARKPYNVIMMHLN